ncbi:MAG: hypothetical protein ACFB16_09085 [Phormidesmis sp.]
MKALLAVLSATFLLLGCSGSGTGDDVSDSGAIAPETSAQSETDTENEDADITANNDTEDETGVPEDVGSESDDEDIPGLNQKNVQLIVEDQSTAGQIIVEKVATSRDGWVSIHKTDAEGGMQLPQSIGEARVDSGDNEEIVVDLWEAPDIGEKLWVLLHIDAGERGQYEFPGEDKAVRKNGETMARSFIVEDPNPEDEEDTE